MEWLKIQKLNNLRTEHNFSTKILNLCFRWHILRSYRFVAEVTFNRVNGTGTTDDEGVAPRRPGISDLAPEGRHPATGQTRNKKCGRRK